MNGPYEEAKALVNEVRGIVSGARNPGSLQGELQKIEGLFSPLEDKVRDCGRCGGKIRGRPGRTCRPSQRTENQACGVFPKYANRKPAAKTERMISDIETSVWKINTAPETIQGFKDQLQPLLEQARDAGTTLQRLAQKS